MNLTVFFSLLATSLFLSALKTSVSSLSKKSISHEHLNIEDISYQQQVFPYQILQTNITRTVWQTVRRITNEIRVHKAKKNPLKHGKESRDLRVQHNWLSHFETLEEILEDLDAYFRANDLILEGKAIAKASFRTLVPLVRMRM